MRKIVFFVALLLVFNSGCASDTETDRLWRQGYGFNNPNPERIRNGQQPVDFNGSEHRDEEIIWDVIGALLGRLLDLEW